MGLCMLVSLIVILVVLMLMLVFACAVGGLGERVDWWLVFFSYCVQKCCWLVLVVGVVLITFFVFQLFYIEMWMDICFFFREGFVLD